MTAKQIEEGDEVLVRGRVVHVDGNDIRVTFGSQYPAQVSPDRIEQVNKPKPRQVRDEPD